MTQPPLMGPYQPTAEDYRRLLHAAAIIEENVPGMTQALEDLRNDLTALATAETQQTATLEAQVAIVTSLSGAVSEALTVLSELRAGTLTPEQQQVIDAATASIAATVAGTASQSAVLASQSAKLQSLADSLNAATEEH